jgi:ribonuclease R
MVAAEITRWPTSTRGALGRVADVLGDIDAPGVDTEIIIRKFGIPDEHAPDAVAEAVRLGGAVSPKDISGRTDFRNIPTVTIDGEHARDFDDAITIERLPNGHYWLGVHIADVSHYVQEGSALDREATSAAPRSTSPSAPCTCSRTSCRPGCARSTRRSIASCSRA